MKKAVVLLSGGIDSTTCLALAVKKYSRENIIALSLYYGQKHDKELKSASDIANYYNVKIIQEDISNIMKYAKNVCTLVKNGNDIQDGTYSEQIKNNSQGRVNTYVPFRNGLLLSIATSYADSLFPNEYVDIIYGAHKDDACNNAYADCSEEFAYAMNKAINIGTYGKIKLYRPFIDKNKAEIVKEGTKLNVPYDLTWSCYKGGKNHCGVCATCLDRKKAFELNNIIDKTIYEN